MAGEIKLIRRIIEGGAKLHDAIFNKGDCDTEMIDTACKIGRLVDLINHPEASGRAVATIFLPK